MGPHVCVILSSLMTDTEVYASYNTIKEKFNAYNVHPFNEVYESSQSHERNQQPGETVDALYTVPKNIIKKCNYPFLVKDRLML